MPLDISKLIPELQDIPEIRTFQDIMRVRDFVFSTVPFLDNPTALNVDLRQYGGFSAKSITQLYQDFKSFKAGGWCGINATFFDILMTRYGIKTRPYNYGLPEQGLTHIGIIVTYDGIEFFMDPYFAAHYVHKDGFPLAFRDLMRLVTDRKFDRFHSQYSDIKKPVLKEDGTIGWRSPEHNMDFVTAGSPYKKTLMSIFGVDDPRILMLIKI